ncbi:predicted protein, partial [Nematostella vectensis]
QEIPVEFEAFPPAKCDFTSMKNLLKQLFLKNTVNLSELADLIIAQDKIGSIIKQAEDSNNPSAEEEGEYEEEIYGLVSVLDLAQHKEKQCVKQIKDLLLEKCKACSKPEALSSFQNILSNKSVGLLISERFINIPPQIAPPLYRTLGNELKEQNKKDKSFNLDHLLLISKSFREKESKSSKKKKGRPDKKSAKVDESSLKAISFSNVEDEVFIKASQSTFSFSYPVAASDEETLLGGKWEFDDAVLEPYRTVMVIPFKQLSPIITQMEELVNS